MLLCLSWARTATCDSAIHLHWALRDGQLTISTTQTGFVYAYLVHTALNHTTDLARKHTVTAITATYILCTVYQTLRPNTTQLKAVKPKVDCNKEWQMVYVAVMLFGAYRINKISAIKNLCKMWLWSAFTFYSAMFIKHLPADGSCSWIIHIS